MKNKKLILIILAIILFIMIITLLIVRKSTLANNTSFSSEIYKIENNFIENISSQTSIELYKKYFDVENCNIKVFNENNQEITTNYIYTGSITTIFDNNNRKIETYINIIKGDITKDGQVNEDDATKLNNYLTNNTTLEATEIKSADLNNDNQINTDDLNILKDLLQGSYTNIVLNKENLTLRTGNNERLIANITPNKILNQNAIWTSSNESVATVDESGLITPHKDGETIITATTIDNKLSVSTKITVDNTPTLSSTNGTAYVGGNNLNITITATDYQDLSCEVANALIASCSIQNNILSLTPINQGNTKVTVKSSKYGETTYNLTVLLTNLSVFPKTNCFKPNASYAGGIVSPTNAGKIEVISITDKEIVKNAYIINKNFGVTTGSKTGDAEIVFRENNGNKIAKVTAYVYRLSLEKNSGTVHSNEKPLSIKITSENTGKLTCSSNDQEIASCQIKDNNLIVNPISQGKTNITISGTKCGIGRDSITYKVDVEEALSTDNTLSNLSLANGNITPKYTKNTLNYKAIINDSKTIINATATDKSAKISGDIGEQKLNYGANIFKIIVTSALGEERTYIIIVERPLINNETKDTTQNSSSTNNSIQEQKSNSNSTIINKNSDASLKSLTIKGYKINFEKNKFTYELSIDNSITSLDINATPTNSKATVTIDETNNLQVGENFITITVTAEDGTICKYILKITRKENELNTIKDSVVDTSSKIPSNKKISIFPKIPLAIVIISSIIILVTIIFIKRNISNKEN